MIDLMYLEFIDRVCSVCGAQFKEMNIPDINPRSICDKCMKKYIRQQRKKNKGGEKIMG